MKTILTLACITLVVVGSMAKGIRAADNLNPQTDTLSWGYASVQDFTSNETITLPGKFVVYAKSRIEWIQNNGADTKAFTITSAQGTWSDAQTNGIITYQITAGESTGTVTITRTTAECRLELVLHNPKRPNPLTYHFTINNVSNHQ